jgi:hypothetical protein
MSEAERIYSREGRGRRASDNASAEIASDKSDVLMKLLTGLVSVRVALVGWLCLGQMETGKMLVRMEERSQANAEQTKIFHQELERLTLTDARLSLRLENFRVLAAQHGWKEDPQ